MSEPSRKHRKLIARLKRRKNKSPEDWAKLKEIMRSGLLNQFDPIKPQEKQ